MEQTISFKFIRKFFFRQKLSPCSSSGAWDGVVDHYGTNGDSSQGKLMPFVVLPSLGLRVRGGGAPEEDSWDQDGTVDNQNSFQCNVVKRGFEPALIPKSCANATYNSLISYHSNMYFLYSLWQLPQVILLIIPYVII